MLPSGIVEVCGTFGMGARVDISDEAGTVFAFGLVSYAANEISRMKGQQANLYASILGYKCTDEILDREALVLLERTTD